MRDQDNGMVSTLQRPTTDDPEAWKAYWESQGQVWRTQAEIDEERQTYLVQRKAIIPNRENGIYPFKDIELSPADVEWLLAMHENGRGPVDWSDERQRNRKGIDLRGAILSTIDLSYLPLARTCGGLTVREWDSQESNQRDWARIHLERAHLYRTHLEGIDLSGAYMEGADLSYAFLERSYLVEVHLERTRLHKAHLDHAYLREAHVEGSHITQAYLYETDLSLSHLEGKKMSLDDLNRVRRWDKSFPSVLPPAELNGSFFDSGTKLENIFLGDNRYGSASLADLHWGDANLLTIDWTAVSILGDEWKAKQPKKYSGANKDKQTGIQEHLAAVRANRQLAVALQVQGVNEVASYFAYRAQKLQRLVFRRQKKFGQYIFSFFLDLLAGYGYRPGRSVLWYLTVIVGFALAYHFLGGLSLNPPDALIFSIMSFHGRGFFPSLSQETNLHNPLVMLAATEAIIGLLIEISFIATFTQRFFGK